MHIVIATGIYPPQVGGPATYSKLLKDKLPGMGFDVSIVNFGEVLKYPKGIRHFIYFSKLLKASSGADIIYAQDPVSVGVPALFVSKILHKKLYLKIVGDYAWEQGVQRYGVLDRLDEFSTNSTGYSWEVRRLKRLQQVVSENADKIIVPSQYLKRIVGNWGINQDKITVIYNSFDTPVAPLTGVSSKTGKTLLTAGRLVPWKGFKTLIKLMPELLSEIPGIHLKIAGDGPDKLVLVEEINRLNLQESVTLLGNLDKKKLYEEIRLADVFILNTSYEGLSHQLLEVMALGTPIITTNVGGNPELITDRESGRLVTYDNREEIKKAVIEILDNKEEALKFIYNAQNKVQRFSEEKMLNELTQVLTTN